MEGKYGLARLVGGWQYFSVPHRFLQDSKDSWGFLRIPEDSSGLHYNLSNFELEENNSVKSSGILRTGTEFGRISAKPEYSTSLLDRGHVTYFQHLEFLSIDRLDQLKSRFIKRVYIS